MVPSRLRIFLSLANFIVFVGCDTTCQTGFLSSEKCQYGCCDNGSYARCCSWNDVYIGIIVGSIIGGLFLIALIIGAVCICVHCSRPANRGNVVNPRQPQIHIIYTTNTGYGPPMNYPQGHPHAPGYNPYYPSPPTNAQQQHIVN